MSKQYFPTIGLEIHAELKTRTKMFCDSANDPQEKRPNANICPICMGHPGTLPVVNKEAVKHVLKVGLSVGGTIADYSEFDRKNYFYPDIPKGYQISQYKFPLVKGGSLCGVELTRVHLEEDTARSSHEGGDENISLVDFNRAGVPLMELVTEPVIESAQQAVAFAKELQLLLRYLGAGDANMEKGEMRVEANISVSAEKGKFGKKVEVKNLNSFRSVERAINYELERHAEVLEGGGEVIQETRGWDEQKGKTFSQRKKEESHDYRYFPDPDIPKLKISEVADFASDELKKEIKELPWEKRTRLEKLGLKKTDVEVFVSNVPVGIFFDEISSELKDKGKLLLASNYIVTDLLGLMKGSDDVKMKASEFAKLIDMASEGKISSRAAKDILKIMFESGGSPAWIAQEKNLLQQSDESDLIKSIDSVIAANPSAVSEFKSGKESVIQYLIGQCMKETKGRANPSVLRESLIRRLKAM